jgi:hypothetical protein
MGTAHGARAVPSAKLCFVGLRLAICNFFALSFAFCNADHAKLQSGIAKTAFSPLNSGTDFADRTAGMSLILGASLQKQQ